MIKKTKCKSGKIHSVIHEIKQATEHREMPVAKMKVHYPTQPPWKDINELITTDMIGTKSFISPKIEIIIFIFMLNIYFLKKYIYYLLGRRIYIWNTFKHILVLQAPI